MSINICSVNILVFLVIISIIKDVNNAVFDGFGNEVRGHSGEVLEFGHIKVNYRRSGKATKKSGKKNPPRNIEPIRPQTRYKRSRSHHDLSYNDSLDRYHKKQHFYDSVSHEMNQPMNPLVRYEVQHAVHKHKNPYIWAQDNETKDNNEESRLKRNEYRNELIKPFLKNESYRHRHNDIVNSVLKKAMHHYSLKFMKEKKTTESTTATECYDCSDSDKLEHSVKSTNPSDSLKAKKEGYTGPPVKPIDMKPKLRLDKKWLTEDNPKKSHRLRSKHTKKTTEKKKKSSTAAPEPDILRSGREKSILRSTRMTPMYEMQAEEDRDRNKNRNKSIKHNKKKYNEKDETDPIKIANAAYENRFVLSPYAVEKQFKILLDDFPGAQYSTEVLGRTVSYNNILLLKITKRNNTYFRANDDAKYAKANNDKKIIFIVHALSCKGLQNLYSLTVETYLKKLLSYYLKHLDKFDIYLIPLGNPDGYSYIKNRHNRIWNKNLSPQAECPGVDLDRNFDVAWNSSKGASSCEFEYPGASPFSEPESRAVRDVLHKYSYNIVAYIHVHAGTYNTEVIKGDAVLYPKGYSETTMDDDRYIDMKGEIDEAIKNANFKSLTVGVDTLYNWYGKVSGSSVDYAATVYGIPYAMEMVMQIYQDPALVNVVRMWTGEMDELEYHALTQVWSRVIDVVFNSIYKNLQMNDADK